MRGRTATSRRRRAVLVAIGAGAIVLVPAGAAQAHPLGNFTVNHYNGLTLHSDRVDALAVVDVAEIPTQQELPSIDTDGNGVLSAAELAAHAGEQCARLVSQQALVVDGTAVPLASESATLVTVSGAAGLPTLRLTCELSAAADLSAPATIAYTDSFRGDNVGWHEMTATGDGVRLVTSPVPSQSVSDELRAYPQDLLSSPLDDRSVTLQTEPGDGVSAAGPGSVGDTQDPFSRAVAWGDRKLAATVGAVELTPWLGSLAMLLAVMLGAGHALLPGHGKTVMAAYLAGRRGSRRDAYKVGGIVTLTHTASVLVLGLVISVSAAVLGEQALRYLGVVSGVIIALVGGFLLRDALRARKARHAEHALVGHVHADEGTHSHPGHAHDDPPHAGHSHDGHSDAGHLHDGDSHAGHSREGAHPADVRALAPATARSTSSFGGWLSHSHSHAGDHTHNHEGDHAHDHGDDHTHNHDGGHAHDRGDERSHGHAHDHQHGSGDAHSHSHASAIGSGGRTGLIGMGIAGGLVPSPSALIVLLGSIALGRTVFGVLLVLLYGVGMAGTLTAVGLLLVRLRGRLDGLNVSGRVGTAGARLVAALPVITAVLVLVVGIGLAVRGLLRPV